MAITSVGDFLSVLGSARLLTAEQEESLRRESEAAPTGPEELAQVLVRRKWLTLFQLRKLWSGRAAELAVGPYVVLDLIAEGGMGHVFKARHRETGNLAAVKVVREELAEDPELVRRFGREVRAAARLDHPNVVRAYEAGQAGASCFIAMEFLDGIDLADLLRRGGPLPVPQACDYARQAALGLQHAHDHGLVHRDVKPSNLFLCLADSVVKVLDLGLARVSRTKGDEASSGKGPLTAETTVIGTPDYLAPEQTLDSRTVDGRADIYGLGCTLYHLLTGKPPFPGGTLPQKLIKHRRIEPAPVEVLRPAVTPALARVVRRMMAKSPGDRYQTPGEAAAALAPFCHDGAAGGPQRPSAGAGLTWLQVSMDDQAPPLPIILPEPPPAPPPGPAPPVRTPWLTIGVGAALGAGAVILFWLLLR